MFSKLPLKTLYVMFAFAYVVLAMNMPISLSSGPFDDGLFMKIGYQIANGNWLGPYSQMTLAKGPGYPIFLAINSWLGFPVTLTMTLLYVFACALMARTLLDLGMNRYIVFITFIVILFHPELTPSRIIRDSIYPALTLIVVSGVIHLIFTPQHQKINFSRILLFGICFGFFWVTREEGIWIVPSMLLMLAIKFFQLKKQNITVNYLLARIAIFSFSALIFIWLIALTNNFIYGRFEVVDIKGTAFSQANDILNSVDVGDEVPRIPVSFKKRQKIYEVSPTFLQLKDYFEVTGKGWTEHGCRIYPETCGDYAGGWWMWAFRDAVASKGYYDSPIRAADFYNKITKEVEEACRSGVIKCHRNIIPFIPNISLTQLFLVPGKMVEGLKVATLQSGSSTKSHGNPSSEGMDLMQIFLRQSLIVPPVNSGKVYYTGWFYSKKQEWIVLACSVDGGDKFRRPINRMPSNDIADHFNDKRAKFQRFNFSVADNEECNVVADSSVANHMPTKSFLKQTNIKMGENSFLYLDDIYRSDFRIKSVDWAQKFNNILQISYSTGLPILVIIGMLSYLIQLVQNVKNKVEMNPLFIISTMFWCLLFTRILLLSIVDVSSFPAVHTLYMFACYPIICLASLVSLATAIYSGPQI